MITLTWEELLAIALFALMLGLSGGWYGFYSYANYHYMHHPEFFKARLEAKIARKQQKERQEQR